MTTAPRPDVLHAGTVRSRTAKPHSRAEWRRHLHQEPPGLLRRMHKPQVPPPSQPPITED